MPQDATLHVKLDSATDRQLRKLAYDRGKSKGQLVREAISACYQTALDDLPLGQQRAVVAYQGGFVSIGKLARVMGMHALELRTWLSEHKIVSYNPYTEGDTGNA